MRNLLNLRTKHHLLLSQRLPLEGSHLHPKSFRLRSRSQKKADEEAAKLISEEEAQKKREAARDAKSKKVAAENKEQAKEAAAQQKEKEKADAKAEEEKKSAAAKRRTKQDSQQEDPSPWHISSTTRGPTYLQLRIDRGWGEGQYHETTMLKNTKGWGGEALKASGAVALLQEEKRRTRELCSIERAVAKEVPMFRSNLPCYVDERHI